MYDEEYEQEKFIRAVGGRSKADELQRIWNNSFPHSTYDIFHPKSKTDVFKEKARDSGFTTKQINAFLNLR